MTKINKPKILVIVGPTASGKSELAVKLAKRFNGEVISADSRQVYKGLDIGTNKARGTWAHVRGWTSDIGVFMYRKTPHHCIDFVDPKRQFSVAEYKQCAEKAINDIASRKKLPILAGGTGLYIQAVVDDISIPEVPPNKQLRAKLEKKTPAQLFAMLRKLDPARAKDIDAKNPRRLMRAIEIAKAIGKTPRLKTNERYDTLMIGLMPKPTKIKAQGVRMLKAGLLKEIKKLLTQEISKRRISQMGFEYKYPLQYLNGRIKSLKDLEDTLAKENWRYAKRQMTWFKRDKRIRWVTPEKAVNLCRKQLKSPSRRQRAC